MSRYLAIGSLLNKDDTIDEASTTDREQSAASEATAVSPLHPRQQQQPLQPLQPQLLQPQNPPRPQLQQPSFSSKAGPEYIRPWDERMSPAEAMRQFYSAQFPSETREVVIFYFEYFYGICPIFHPATFVCRLVCGSVDPLLLDVMRAKTARLITKHTGRPVDLDAIIEHINRRLLLDLESPSFDYVRAVVLMTTLSGGENKFMSYNSLVCLASSMVARLGWHTLDLGARDATSIPWLDWAELEARRRTFWIVYQLDSYQSLLADRPMSIGEDRV
ncbi:hypothetical protein EV174_005025, partial [Coemansia sp. RSA 2320]